MNRRFLIWSVGLGLVIMFLFSGTPIQAQCAMCRASVESSNGEDQDTIANGLNKGILYLMAVPYILAGGIGFFWYKYSRRK